MGLYDVINYFNYTPTNSSIDVVVIEQPDGTLKASPFHVNFGFGSVLRAEDRKVFIFVNNEEVDVQMRLGKSGEAFFVLGDFSGEMTSPPESPSKPCFSRTSSQTSRHSRKLSHSLSHKASRSKSNLSADSSRSEDVFHDAFDPSSALSDSEIEVKRPQPSHSMPCNMGGYLSDPEPHTVEEPSSTTKSVTVWRWGHLPQTEPRSSEVKSKEVIEEPSTCSVEPESDPETESIEKNPLSKQGSQTVITQTEITDSEHEEKNNYPLDRNMELSLCGGLDRNISEETFQKYKVTWQMFQRDPKSIIENPNLVIKDEDRYLNWSTAAAIAVSKIFFNERLPDETLEKLKTPKRNASRSWSLFGFRSSRRERSSLPDAKTQSCESNNNQGCEASSSPSPETSALSTATSNGKTLILQNEELQKLRLKPGKNKIEFQVITKFQGTAKTEAAIYLWKSTDKIVVSDIDGTVTKSDVVGHISNVLYIDYTHKGIHNLYHGIEKNGYKFVYVSSRGISQSSMTKTYINWTKQDGRNLPYGPILLNPASLISALLREVWTRNPEEFKIDCLSGIAHLFPDGSCPFYAGFGNKSNDEKAYRTVLIPDKRIFTIDKKGVVKTSDQTLTNFSTSYEGLEQVVDYFFPHISNSGSQTSLHHLGNSFWRLDLPDIDFEAELDQS